MKLSEIQKRCHQQAVDLGFYDGVPATYDGSIEAKEHLWKQLCHVFIEIGELKDSVLNVKPHFHDERADVAIVLMDLMGWLGIKVHYEDNDDFEPQFSVVMDLSCRLADLIRKQGVGYSRIEDFASSIISWLGGGKELKQDIIAKLDYNLTRGKRYGIE